MKSLKTTAIAAVLLILAGCASPTYNPSAARSFQDQARNSNPYLNCPTRAVVHCDIEGGALAGKTYSNCRCVR